MLHHVSPYLQHVIVINTPPCFSISQNVSPIAEQHTFCSVLYGEDPVSDLSLHMLRAPRSVLWVVDCGSLVTSVPPTRARAPALDVIEYGLAKAKSPVLNQLLGHYLYHV